MIWVVVTISRYAVGLCFVILWGSYLFVINIIVFKVFVSIFYFVIIVECKLTHFVWRFIVTCYLFIHYIVVILVFFIIKPIIIIILLLTIFILINTLFNLRRIKIFFNLFFIIHKHRLLTTTKWTLHLLNSLIVFITIFIFVNISLLVCSYTFVTHQILAIWTW